MKPAVLVTKRVYPEAVALLREHAEVDYADSYDGLTPEELLERARGKSAIVSQLTDKFPAEAIGQLEESVRVIANVAVGFDNIDTEAATARGILVTNTPDVLTETTADFAWALLMAAARRIPEGQDFLKSGQWSNWRIDLLVGQDIYGATLGIFGMGRIGRSFARRAAGFSMRLLYHDVMRAPEEVERELGLTFVSKEQLLREADFVSLHVPYLEATHHLIGTTELALMKPTAVLVNTARGPVVDEPALAEALAAGRIGAAGLDVFENEPQVQPKLLELSNVVLTPHIASASVETRRQMSLMAAGNALAVLAGERPPNLVNREAWNRAARGVSS